VLVSLHFSIDEGLQAGFLEDYSRPRALESNRTRNFDKGSDRDGWGKGIWRALRELSDYAIVFTIKNYFSKQAFKTLPVFLTNKQEIAMALEDQNEELMNSLRITNANVDETILDRNIRALKVHV